MSIGSDIKTSQLEGLSSAPRASCSSEAVAYILSAADAFIIVISSLAGGIGYTLSVGYPMPNVLPYCGVGLLASLIHILRMRGSDYYDFPDCAKPRVEIAEILVCWFTTGLFISLLAFLLKLGVDYSRGAFFGFYFLAPIGLLGVRKITKIALADAIARGAVGRLDTVLIGEFNEIDALGPQDM